MDDIGRLRRDDKTKRKTTALSVQRFNCVFCLPSPLSTSTLILALRYSTAFDFVYKRPIEDIMINASEPHVIKFKELVFYNDEIEYCKRFYYKSEAMKKISLFTDFYNNSYHSIRPNLVNNDPGQAIHHRNKAHKKLFHHRIDENHYRNSNNHTKRELVIQDNNANAQSERPKLSRGQEDRNNNNPKISKAIDEQSNWILAHLESGNRSLEIKKQQSRQITDGEPSVYDIYNRSKISGIITISDIRKSRENEEKTKQAGNKADENALYFGHSPDLNLGLSPFNGEGRESGLFTLRGSQMNNSLTPFLEPTPKLLLFNPQPSNKDSQQSVREKQPLIIAKHDEKQKRPERLPDKQVEAHLECSNNVPTTTKALKFRLNLNKQPTDTITGSHTNKNASSTTAEQSNSKQNEGVLPSDRSKRNNFSTVPPTEAISHILHQGKQGIRPKIATIPKNGTFSSLIAKNTKLDNPKKKICLEYLFQKFSRSPYATGLQFVQIPKTSSTKTLHGPVLHTCPNQQNQVPVGTDGMKAVAPDDNCNAHVQIVNKYKTSKIRNLKGFQPRNQPGEYLVTEVDYSRKVEGSLSRVPSRQYFRHPQRASGAFQGELTSTSRNSRRRNDTEQFHPRPPTTSQDRGGTDHFREQKLSLTLEDLITGARERRFIPGTVKNGRSDTYWGQSSPRVPSNPSHGYFGNVADDNRGAFSYSSGMFRTTEKIPTPKQGQVTATRSSSRLFRNKKTKIKYEGLVNHPDFQSSGGNEEYYFNLSRNLPSDSKSPPSGRMTGRVPSSRRPYEISTYNQSNLHGTLTGRLGTSESVRTLALGSMTLKIPTKLPRKEQFDSSDVGIQQMKPKLGVTTTTKKIS